MTKYKNVYWVAAFNKDEPDFTAILTKDHDLVIEFSGIGNEFTEYLVNAHNYYLKERQKPKRIMFDNGGDNFEIIIDREYLKGEILTSQDVKLKVIKGNKRSWWQKLLNRINKKWYPKTRKIKVKNEEY